MKASFDGIRRNLASEFNELAKTELSHEQKEIMARMRGTVAGMLCMYDEGQEDCHCLIDDVHLEDVE